MNMRIYRRQRISFLGHPIVITGTLLLIKINLIANGLTIDQPMIQVNQEPLNIQRLNHSDNSLENQIKNLHHGSNDKELKEMEVSTHNTNRHTLKLSTLDSKRRISDKTAPLTTYMYEMTTQPPRIAHLDGNNITKKINKNITRTESTASKSRSYDIGENATNKINVSIQKEDRTLSFEPHSMLNGAGLLAFANIENSGVSNPKTNNVIEKDISEVDANSTIKSLADWTKIIQTVENNSSTVAESVLKIVNNEMILTTGNMDIKTTTTDRNFATLKHTSDHITVQNSISETTHTSNELSSIVSTSTDATFEYFTKNKLPIYEVYNKKSIATKSTKPDNRIDVFEYFRTETTPTITSTQEITSTMHESEGIERTTVTDKENRFIQTTSNPETTTITFLMSTSTQNYGFTTTEDASPTTQSIFTTTHLANEIPTNKIDNDVDITTSTTVMSEDILTAKIEPQESTTELNTEDPLITLVSTTSTEPTIETTINFVTEVFPSKKMPNLPFTVLTTDIVSTTMNNNADVISSTIVPPPLTTSSTELNQPEPSTDVKAIIVLLLSAVGVIAFILLVAFLYIIRKRQKQNTYGQRCRPVSLDAYSLDNVSVYNSVRRKGNNLRVSKRSYGNSAFEDPNLQSHTLTVTELATFVQNKYAIYDEFKEIPQVISRVDELPEGCEDKNRYANVVPLPETRVYLSRIGDSEKTEYINANYVKGPQDSFNYYIATQAPLKCTVNDFWRMVWEQQSKVIIMSTDFTENGIEKCAEYLPSSVVLDNVQTYGGFQVTLKSREVKEKYAMSTIYLKHLESRKWREIIHFWYSWPESGVPSDETSLIALLLEARSHLKLSLPEQYEQSDDKPVSNVNYQKNSDITVLNGSLNTMEKSRSLQRTQGPLLVHCSPGTGRTGCIIACDIVLRTLEIPPRQIDVPKIVYAVRRGRASAVQTKQQYEFIYKVGHVYATKLTGPNID